MNVAKILQIDDHLETESDQTILIDRICDAFIKLESKKRGHFDAHDQLSGDRTIDNKNSNESARSSQRPDDTTLSPQNGRLRKKQPKQSKYINKLN